MTNDETKTGPVHDVDLVTESVRPEDCLPPEAVQKPRYDCRSCGSQTWVLSKSETTMRGRVHRDFYCADLSCNTEIRVPKDRCIFTVVEEPMRISPLVRLFAKFRDVVVLSEGEGKAEPEVAAPAKTPDDAVTSPSHYKLLPGVEVIDVIRARLTPEEFRGYLKGNRLKYALRAGRKGKEDEDLGKEMWYARAQILEDGPSSPTHGIPFRP